MARKQGIALLAVLLAAGCGSARQEPRFMRVGGDGYSFAAPAGWKVVRKAGTTSASRGDRLVSVTVFTLARAVRPALLPRARKELDRVSQQLAAREHGRVVRSAPSPEGARYVIELADGKIQELDFRLHGRREYQLLCTRRSGDDRSACERLRVSFAPA